MPTGAGNLEQHLCHAVRQGRPFQIFPFHGGGSGFGFLCTGEPLSNASLSLRDLDLGEYGNGSIARLPSFVSLQDCSGEVVSSPWLPCCVVACGNNCPVSKSLPR